MIRHGTVEQSGTGSHVDVLLDNMASCGRCAKRGGCGIELLPSRSPSVTLACNVGSGPLLQVGDRVAVELSDPGKAWLSIALLAYGLPLIGMITGAVAGFLLYGFASDTLSNILNLNLSQDVFSATGFLLGLGGGLFAWDRLKLSANTDSINMSGKIL